MNGFDSNKVSENYTVKGDKIRNDEILCRNKPIIRPINVQISIVDYLRLHREHGLLDPAGVETLGCQKGQKRGQTRNPEIPTILTL